ncbi:MAG: iron ABC transporter permease [Bacteroidales bacterium]|nr:iron ABC transporter permease [Bacteroidales bacterium]
METIETSYRSYQGKKYAFLLLMFVVLIAFAIVGITLGSASIGLNDIFNVIFARGSEMQHQIIVNIRLPRVLSAILAGTALAVSGAAMQTILRNPLGSPFTLGVSNAAAFGAAFAVIVLSAGTSQSGNTETVMLNNPYSVTISAFLWSMVSTLIIFLLARFKGATPEVMILTGIILGSLFSAGITALQYFADDIEISSIVFWTFGDIGRSSWRDFLILLGVVLIATVIFLRNRWNYNALDAGDEMAKSLGVHVQRTRLTGMVTASLATAVTVSFFGIIAFVGLVVPHIVRRVIGGDERFLIPASALFGGMFLLVSDTVARTVIAPVVLPVGILTSFLGAPLFLYLLIRGIGKGYW